MCAVAIDSSRAKTFKTPVPDVPCPFGQGNPVGLLRSIVRKKAEFHLLGMRGENGEIHPIIVRMCAHAHRAARSQVKAHPVLNRL
jgi:hypothetical protein